MADDFVSRVKVDINGQAIEDFKNFKEGELELARAVNLMHKTGFCEVTPRYAFSLDYVIPADRDEFDFSAVKDATVTIEKDGGGRRIYSGVRRLKIGETTYDGESEAVRTVDFGATTMVDE